MIMAQTRDMDCGSKPLQQAAAASRCASRCASRAKLHPIGARMVDREWEKLRTQSDTVWRDGLLSLGLTKVLPYLAAGMGRELHRDTN